MNADAEFKSIDILLNSDCVTRAADSFCLALIKMERQMRKLFTHLIFQFPAFSGKDIPKLKEVLAENRKVYFEGFIRGFNAIHPKSLDNIYGSGYIDSLSKMKRYISYRNKMFHGQLTGEDLSREDLIIFVQDIREWCYTLAKKANKEFGYDGFARNSFQKSKLKKAFLNSRIEIKSISEYSAFISEYMERC